MRVFGNVREVVIVAVEAVVKDDDVGDDDNDSLTAVVAADARNTVRYAAGVSLLGSNMDIVIIPLKIYDRGRNYHTHNL